MSPLTRRWAEISVLAALCFAAARLGLTTASVPASVSPVWPVSGVALAALLLRGPQLWPGIALGALMARLSTGTPVDISLGVASANTVEALVAVLALRQTGRTRTELRSVGDAVAFVGLAAIFASALGATHIVCTLWFGGILPDGQFLDTWNVVWLAHVLGILILTPAILAWVRPQPWNAYRDRAEEALLIAILLLAAAILVFSPVLTAVQAHYAIASIVFPFVIWPALRFGLLGGSSATLLVALIATVGTALGHGPFAGHSMMERLIYLQFFLVVVGLTSLGLAGYSAERERHERMLTEAKNQADAANAAKDRFLAILSHELRTPLTPVLVLTSALEQNSQIPPPVKEELATIRRNVELEVRLIDDLLDLTRVASGKLQLRPAPLDLHQTIGAAQALCQADLLQKRLRLIMDLQAGRCWVQADSARLQQVVWNLLKNAIKFTPPGREIHVRTDNPASDQIRLEVSDTGIGIAPELLNRIFEPFEQASEAIVQQHGGLGLGLAISKALVELHGGTIRAASEGEGRGASFVIELTAIQPPAVSLDPTPHVAPTRQALRVLLVEDHADTCLAITRLLQALACEVSSAGSVAAAESAADAQSFDLLISDIGLPDGDGWELMRRLRQRRPIRGIALSGFGMEQDLQRSREAGFRDHLTKPVDSTRLREAILRAMV